jgi:hypothetical protein
MKEANLNSDNLAKSFSGKPSDGEFRPTAEL